MNRLLRLTSAAFLLLAVSACNKDGYTVSNTGLHYNLIREVSKEKAHPGQVLQLNMAYYNSKDSLLYDSRVIGDSFLLELTPPTFIGGLEEGLAMLGEGDSASFLLPADSIFDKLFHVRLPSYINKGDQLRFNVGVISVLDPPELKAKLREFSIRRDKAEQRAIENYLAQNNLHIKPAEPGIYFVVMREGQGRKPVTGDSVEVAYTGRTLNGQVFDASEKAGRNLKYRIGTAGMLDAWENAVTSMKEGSLARLILSSGHAFGSSTAGPVPPGTPVVFDIELIRIIPQRKSDS